MNDEQPASHPCREVAGESRGGYRVLGAVHSTHDSLVAVVTLATSAAILRARGDDCLGGVRVVHTTNDRARQNRAAEAEEPRKPAVARGLSQVPGRSLTRGWPTPKRQRTSGTSAPSRLGSASRGCDSNQEA
jgi:hypothetical protein